MKICTSNAPMTIKKAVTNNTVHTVQQLLAFSFTVVL